MTPDVVVDVGNTRIKWGRCANRAVVATASLAPDDPPSWQRQCEEWQLGPGPRYVVTGVHPERRERVAGFLRQQGGEGASCRWKSGWSAPTKSASTVSWTRWPPTTAAAPGAARSSLMPAPR